MITSIIILLMLILIAIIWVGYEIVETRRVQQETLHLMEWFINKTIDG